MSGSKLIERPLWYFSFPDQFTLVLGHIWTSSSRLYLVRFVRIFIFGLPFSEWSSFLGPVDSVEE